MECNQAVILAVIITAIVLYLYSNNYSNKSNSPSVNNKNSVSLNPENTEGYRVKSRAYYSCNPNSVQCKPIEKDNYLIINPFVWPYSATATPQEAITQQAPQGIMAEPDHSPLSN